ncbi:4Fe-4S binding protein [Virgibacillus pantothenticus]|uniref:indolepyruvate ferredoxin oxidoreductase subunit alpha n=1 Tax=Virgibacillus pantothenticus TaxID=1473 RepID=UPI001C210A4D|nr:4Fe-4S dicluster domain-containing protein [Virgibacillus pantothenticus]MBU8568799.1 4Fe-4S binding protein [Virgibacillus pantothenticus]MBU8602853.1 4Fe-4S binding protein [Virgibacillus pantothenticus]MBU8636930.1 4Fe-4S binding protein [Virgibacillus pantothenticus]MBU8644685.1 4Fe-4S binding protein [Virgibacillus pantothenticus]MBU8648828.1 4Fe-4S binding protein [Virgibacillus pantothenticus]
MAFVITSPCLHEKSAECVEVCPVDAIQSGKNMYYIDPDICIDCAACETACPVQAIYAEEDVPDEEKEYIEMNRDFFPV